jgi:hypothetical protein
MQMIIKQENKMTFEIDKGKELPPYIKNKKEQLPLADMEVDDSFFYPFDGARVWRIK